MKKILITLIALCISYLLFASEVSDLLQEAQIAYETGDVTTAIKKLDSAKSILEKEQLSSSAEDYIELNSWDIVKIKKNDYLGKKVKVQASYLGITSSGFVYLSEIATNNSYDESLVEKLLSLSKYKKYIFYGTVMDNGSLGTKLYIEAVE